MKAPFIGPEPEMRRRGESFMPLRICMCCAEKMTVISPRNPNMCVGCEQLLEDDCAQLDTLIASVPQPEPVSSPATRHKAGKSSLPEDEFEVFAKST